MSRIAFLGLGAMGSRMAARLLQAGHELTVWNRTGAAAQPLVEQGARQADTPRAAVAGAEFVFAMLRDDAASRTVWCDTQVGALGGMTAGSVAVESSTLSPGWVQELERHTRAAGVHLLEAPVSGSRPAAEAGQLVHLTGGDAAVHGRALPLLQRLGAAAHHLGPVGSAAHAKLATNALLGVHVATLAELIGLLQRHGVDVAAVLRAIAGTSVWAPVDHYLSGTMLAGDFRPQFPVELIAKDFGYALDAAGGAGQAPITAAALEVFRRGVAEGLGADNMTGVVQLYTR